MKLAIQDSIGRAQVRRKPEQHGCKRHRSDGCAAFTLLEVILAVGIAVGLLFVVLFFYRQAALLRDQVLQKSEQISAIRLVMDQLTSDLRSVPPRVSYGTPLAGDGFSLQLVRTEVPGHANWSGGELGRAAYPETDLRLVSYSVGDGTNSFGLMRTVEPLVVKRDPPPSAGAVVMPKDSEGLVALPLTEEIQFIRFRFWDGTDWLEEWSSPGAPLAVEVSLGAEPLPEDATLDDYPYELFQRVVYLPAGGQSSGEETDIMGIEVTSTGGVR